jgi:hypothetical protein
MLGSVPKSLMAAWAVALRFKAADNVPALLNNRRDSSGSIQTPEQDADNRPAPDDRLRLEGSDCTGNMNVRPSVQ